MIESIFQSVGEVRRVDETKLDAVTAVSGSGPAYLFMVAEGMIEAALTLGLDHEAARRLVVGTLAGASTMLTGAHADPAVLRTEVT